MSSFTVEQLLEKADSLFLNSSSMKILNLEECLKFFSEKEDKNKPSEKFYEMEMDLDGLFQEFKNHIAKNVFSKKRIIHPDTRETFFVEKLIREREEDFKRFFLELQLSSGIKTYEISDDFLSAETISLEVAREALVKLDELKALKEKRKKIAGWSDKVV